MALSWNEIKERATLFSKEWENDFNEDAEAKSFMDGFFNIFGIPRRRVASFEPKDVVKNWMRSRTTIEFLGIWEQLNNPDFKGVEFDSFEASTLIMADESQINMTWQRIK